VSAIGERDAEVLRRYNEFMNSPEQKQLRSSYRNEELYRHVWNQEELKKHQVIYHPC
jgi:hypothetical protein